MKTTPASGTSAMASPAVCAGPPEAIVSFDDPLFGPFLEPQLTALRREEHTLGDVAASLLLEAMRNGADRRSIEVRVPVELTLRRSCGCSEP